MSTTISVDRKTKEFLARQKGALEAAEGVQMTWDEFFERTLSVKKPPELTRNEIDALRRLARDARPWKSRA